MKLYSRFLSLEEQKQKLDKMGQNRGNLLEAKNVASTTQQACYYTYPPEKNASVH